jgi:hypothetical protein
MRVPAEPAVVLVDARNVLRSVWPNLPEALVVERAGAWASHEGVTAVVVFDGRAPAGTPGVEVVGTGPESADDWIARRAGELGARGRRFWLVTSDRELRRRAGGLAERTVGGGAFARLLTGV